MRVGIDIHAIGLKQTGNESYIRSLVESFEEMECPGVEFYYYQTRPIPLPDWKGRIRRVRPHTPFIRIPFSFPRHLRRDRIDVAHFQYIGPPSSPCPQVVTIHDISFEPFPEFFSPFERRRLRWLVPAAARRAAHIIAVSEATKRDLMNLYGIPSDRISVVHNGASRQFRTVDSRDDPEERLRALGVARPYILAVGNLQPRKNLQRVIRSYGRLRRDRGVDLDLILAGQSTWGSSRIVSEITRNRLEKNVHLTGFVSTEDLVALYKHAEFSVYASLYEGFGLPVLESMTCGTPVITSNVSSMPEIAGDAAVLVDPRSEEELQEAMARLAEDEGLRRRLRERGLRRAAEFSWRRAAERTLEIYRRVAGGSSA